MIKAIVAMSDNFVIGENGRIPRNKPFDKQRFRDLINNQIIVMGKGTYKSLKNYYPNEEWHPLASKNIVLSETLSVEWITVISDIMQIIENYKDQVLWVIWWEKTYQSFLPYIDELYVTLVAWTYVGDSHFPIDYESFFIEEQNEIGRDTWTMYRKYKKKH